MAYNVQKLLKSDILNYSSCCFESQREAALLLGQFAATDSDCKVDFFSPYIFHDLSHQLIPILCYAPHVLERKHR